MDPAEYVSIMLPFSQANSYTSSKSVLTSVCANNVVGADQAERKSISNTEDLVTMNALDNAAKNNWPNSAIAQYTKVGKLDLYVALEGKNRVSLYQKHNRPIMCKVTESSFPKAKNLEIRKYKYKGIKNLFKNNNYNEIYTLVHKDEEIVLPYPKIILAILTDYGVSEIEGDNSKYFTLSKEQNSKKTILSNASIYGS